MVELERAYQAICRAISDLDEQETHRMLGKWVSGLEPAIARGPGGEIFGLTAAEIPLGVIAPIPVESSEEYRSRRRQILSAYAS